MIDPQQAKAIFEAVVDLSGEQRAAYLDASCPPELRSTVEGLLERFERADTVVFAPAMEQLSWLGPTAVDTPEFERLDEFRIVGKLGEGGMGVVYLAEDESLHRLVALKVLPREYTRSTVRVARLRHEAIVVAQLQHPGIVTVYKVGDDNGVHYLAMEVIDGPTLSQRLDVLRRLPKPERERTIRTRSYLRQQAEFIALVADALHYTHEHNIVHRDVKPSNILIDPDGHPRLSDFGISKNLADPNVTATGGLTGTVPYMSPEQAMARGPKIDGRADVFSLGIVLYETLCLKRPFTGDSNDEILRNLVLREPPRLRTLNHAVSRDLETIIRKALEKDPAHRYQTAAHFAGDLRCYLDGRPILARRPSLWRRTRAWTRQHRVAALATAVAVLLLIIGTLVVAGFEQRRRGMVGVSVSADAPGSEILVQRVDPDTLELGPAQVLGVTPYDGRLAPGQYRFTVLGPEGAFAERMAIMLEPGAAWTMTLSPTAPDPPDANDMVLVPTGAHRFGDPDRSDAMAARQITLPAFYIDRREVSNSEYGAFVTATGHRAPKYWELAEFDADAMADRPVVGVSQDDALAFAAWAGKRLPTFFEWESAMRSPDGRRLPWAPAPAPALPVITVEDVARLQAAKWDWALQEYMQHTRPVDSDPAVTTATGIMHPCTNVSELTESIHVARSNAAIVKGAAWIHPPQYFDLTHTWSVPLGTVSMKTGFRCARSAAPVAPQPVKGEE